MSQTRIQSAVEAVANVAVGYGVALLLIRRWFNGLKFRPAATGGEA